MQEQETSIACCVWCLSWGSQLLEPYELLRKDSDGTAHVGSLFCDPIVGANLIFCQHVFWFCGKRADRARMQLQLIWVVCWVVLIEVNFHYIPPRLVYPTAQIIRRRGKRLRREHAR